jgi:threonine dehydrogenase-like Zn-dependent dehydrogenase
MRAVVVSGEGSASSLEVDEVPAPELERGDLRLRVVASGVNRADLLQSQGLYPPPPGASPILGLECAGEVIEVGEGVSGWSPGARAMALLAGGGYAEEVVVPASCALPVPEALSFEEAAALPEVFLTVFLNVFQLGALPEGGAVLVHGGGSGIGTATIQLVKAAGGTVVATAGSEEKCERWRRCRPGFHRCPVPREQPRVLDGRRAAPTHRPDGWSSRRHPPRLAARQAAPDHRIHPPGATREREGRHRVGVLGARASRRGSSSRCWTVCFRWIGQRRRTGS